MAPETPPLNGSGIAAELTRALVRPIISLYLVGTCGWLWLHGQPVPPELMTLTTASDGSPNVEDKERPFLSRSPCVTCPSSR